MENNTTLGERIKQFVDYKEISLNQLADAVGASNSYFNKVVKLNTSVGAERVEKILRAFPELNAEWLITGEGSMLKSRQQEMINEQEITQLRAEVIELQSKLINCLENQLYKESPGQNKKSS